MNRWPGLPQTRWLTDYRQIQEIDQSISSKINAASPSDFKDKLQGNAGLIYREYEKPQIPKFMCPVCKPDGQGLVDSLRARWERGGAQTPAFINYQEDKGPQHDFFK